MKIQGSEFNCNHFLLYDKLFWLSHSRTLHTDCANFNLKIPSFNSNNIIIIIDARELAINHDIAFESAQILLNQIKNVEVFEN